MAGQKKYRILGFGLIAMGLVMTVFAWMAISSEGKLASDAVETYGTVISASRERQEEPSEIMRRQDKGILTITAEYDGHRKLFSVDGDYKVGDQVLIRYQQGEPQNARIIADTGIKGTGNVIEGTTGGTVAMAIGILLILAGTGLLLRRRKAR